MKRIIYIENEKQLKSQSIKTQIKRFLKRRGRIADVKLETPFTQNAMIKKRLNQIKTTALNEFKAGVKVPKYR